MRSLELICGSRLFALELKTLGLTYVSGEKETVSSASTFHKVAFDSFVSNALRYNSVICQQNLCQAL